MCVVFVPRLTCAPACDALVAPQDRSCTTGSETGTVRSSVISRLERSLEEESGKRLAIAGELAALRAQLDRATKQ